MHIAGTAMVARPTPPSGSRKNSGSLSRIAAKSIGDHTSQRRCGTSPAHRRHSAQASRAPITVPGSSTHTKVPDHETAESSPATSVMKARSDAAQASPANAPIPTACQAAGTSTGMSARCGIAQATQSSATNDDAYNPTHRPCGSPSGCWPEAATSIVSTSRVADPPQVRRHHARPRPARA